MLTSNAPIILVAGADSPAFSVLPEFVTNLEEAVFIGVDAGSLAIIDAGYPLQLAIGDFDSVNGDTMQAIDHAATEVIRYQPEKDDTDMELALAIAQERYPDAPQFILLGAMGRQIGRLDHLLANVWLAYQPRYREILERLHFVEKDQHFHFLQAGDHVITRDAAARYLSLISLSPVKDWTIQGAKYELDGINMPYPRAFISNEFLDDKPEVKLSFSQGLILVMYVYE
ncbi:thiamine diphosphokinase [Suicoccus acidiformans]|uniref:Thiamine diphosphokinase n=1 Tax=Suicoccus acidiformans TaxID=2036206 RepID=A0A347WKI3_9LACT|nr:thiamine diphosphokinase [Suicoccus acidiformans]AXY25590.1 thiamine diphosphokinase [Suicoccus acidiformans]